MLGVSVAEVRQQGVAEDEGGDLAAGSGVDGDRSARRVVHEHGVRVCGRPGQGCRGDVHAEVGDELRLRPEEEPAHPRVQPVGADDEVEAAWGSPFEGHVDAVAVVVQGQDGVAVDEVRVVAAGAGQDRGEITARDLQPVGAGLGGDPSDAVASAVDDGQVGRERGCLAQCWQQIHLLGYGQGGTPDVDRASAGALTSRLLHDGGLHPVSGEPVGERGAGDAGPDHKHAANAHRHIMAAGLGAVEEGQVAEGCRKARPVRAAHAGGPGRSESRLGTKRDYPCSGGRSANITARSRRCQLTEAEKPAAASQRSWSATSLGKS